jgi:hypothetical protein
MTSERKKRNRPRRGGEKNMSKSKRNDDNNAKAIELCNTRLGALKKLVQPGTQMIIDGAPMAPGDVIAVFQKCLDTRVVVDSTFNEYEAALADRDAADAKRRTLDKGLRNWVRTTYGVASKAANDFGYPPPKTPVKTVEVKQQAVTRSRATRKARNTMGSVQKEAVKGTQVVLVDPANPENKPAGTPPAGNPAPTSTK